MENQPRKVVIIGAGSVGTTYCYTLMQSGLADEIALIDRNEKRLEGEVMDLSHGLPFVPPVDIKIGDYSDCRDANIIVVTAGAKQQAGETRLELIKKNAEIVKDICSKIEKHQSDAVLIMVTNPVDLLTYVAIRELGWQRKQIIGSGTVLDTSRFKFMLSQHCDIDPRNIHVYILGEHGDSEIAPWSLAHIAGTRIRDYCQTCRKCDFRKQHQIIVDRVRDSAYHIIDYKGSTYYAIGLSLLRITGAILRDEHSVLTVSTLLKGEYGIEDICLSVPCIVGKEGIFDIIDAALTEEEYKHLKSSADTLRKSLERIELNK